MGIKKLFLIICCLGLVYSQAHVIHAQEISPYQDPTPTPVQYALAYPGILPGHPFYFLKAARDAIWGFLISNPLTKAEFDLLQADKSMQAAAFLSQKKAKSDVIFTTLENSQTKFSEAIDKAQEAKKQGITTHDFVNNMILANQKHQEVISDILKTASKDDKKRLNRELVQVKQLGQKAAALTHK
jgi:hypothetical protein